MEFKVVGKKRVWIALTSREIQSCEANMMEKLCTGGAYCFAIALVGTSQDQGAGKKGEEMP